MIIKPSPGKWMLKNGVIYTKDPIFNRVEICRIIGDYATKDQTKANTALLLHAQELYNALLAIYRSCKPTKFGVDLVRTNITSVDIFKSPSEESVLQMCKVLKSIIESQDE